jgi:hypothetical protein
MSKVFVILQHSGEEYDYSCNAIFAYLKKESANEKLEELVKLQDIDRQINKEYWKRYTKFQKENPILEWNLGFTDYDKQFWEWEEKYQKFFVDFLKEKNLKELPDGDIIYTISEIELL